MGINGRFSAVETVIVRGTFREDIAQSISPWLWPGLSREVRVCVLMPRLVFVCFPSLLS